MVKIIADTTSCIPPDEARDLGISYLPQIIVFGEDTYRDDTEMNARQFLKHLRASSELPKTAAPQPFLYQPIYQEYSEQGQSMVVICPSSDLSGTFRSATVAAQDFPQADVRIVDTRIVAGGMGAIVKEAVKWANAGEDADTIVQKVQAMAKRERVYFVVDTLEYLFKGGRIGAAKALFGSLLQVKPILTFKDGRTEPFDSQRTHKRAMARLKEVLLNDCPRHPSSHLCIMHGDAEEEARMLADEFSILLNIPAETIPIYDLTPAILVHSGPGIIGASYFVSEA